MCFLFRKRPVSSSTRFSTANAINDPAWIPDADTPTVAYFIALCKQTSPAELERLEAQAKSYSLANPTDMTPPNTYFKELHAVNNQPYVTFGRDIFLQRYNELALTYVLKHYDEVINPPPPQTPPRPHSI